MPDSPGPPPKHPPPPPPLAPERLLSAIVDSSDDAIVSKNLKGIVTSWNKGAERIFGYTSDEMVGESILRLLPRERYSEEDDILSRLQRGERVDHFETIRQRKDGELIDVALTISPIRNEQGVIVGASKIARDVTAQKAALRELAEAHERLTRADRMKAEFISTLSHELRSPLTAIIGWIEILKDSPSKEELHEGITVIDRNVRLQSQLISDLLDMSRIEAGKVTLDVQALDLPSIVGEALDSARLAATAKGIRLTSAFSDIGGVTMGDRNRLHQIIWNLLSNAIKFTPKGGRVHVTIERVNSHAEIAVADTGIGIEPEFLSHIFERFKQADASTTRRHGGLGLGLSIVKHLTELHGGTVYARSAGVNRGTTLVVILPLAAVDLDSGRSAAQQRNAQIDATANEQSLGGVKVLIVDDDPDSSAIVSRILRRNHAEVQAAASMDQALQALESFAPDILLTDISMPEHDGYELLAQVRAHPGGRDLPAVALTALARSEDRTRALRAGFQMHIGKPVAPLELIAVVRNLANLRVK
jgi:PAS domain S-box-containing protein